MFHRPSAHHSQRFEILFWFSLITYIPTDTSHRDRVFPVIRLADMKNASKLYDRQQLNLLLWNEIVIWVTPVIFYLENGGSSRANKFEDLSWDSTTTLISATTTVALVAWNNKTILVVLNSSLSTAAQSFLRPSVIEWVMWVAVRHWSCLPGPSSDRKQLSNCQHASQRDVGYWKVLHLRTFLTIKQRQRKTDGTLPMWLDLTPMTVHPAGQLSIVWRDVDERTRRDQAI